MRKLHKFKINLHKFSCEFDYIRMKQLTLAISYTLTLANLSCEQHFKMKAIHCIQRYNIESVNNSVQASVFVSIPSFECHHHHFVISSIVFLDRCKHAVFLSWCNLFSSRFHQQNLYHTINCRERC